MLWTWLGLLVFLLALFIGVARELRTCQLGYLLQTACIVVLYGAKALHTGDADMWAAFAGLVVIRGGLIPIIIRWKLPPVLMDARENRFVAAPTFLLMAFCVLGAVSAGVATVWAGRFAVPFGFALGTLLAALAGVALTHQAGQQMFGLLSAENGIDLAVAAILSRIPVGVDDLIFVDIALATMLSVVLLVRLKASGSTRLHDLRELRG
ncbi:MAG: hypothetical protein K6T78_03045 [Alicyclobacillus sp.]|nr:hypothetical protein [Alicyclobacillus sp.]